MTFASQLWYWELKTGQDCSQSAPMAFTPPLKKPCITLEVSLKSLDQTLGELTEIYMFESVFLQPPKVFLRLKFACKSFVLGYYKWMFPLVIEGWLSQASREDLIEILQSFKILGIARGGSKSFAQLSKFNSNTRQSSSFLIKRNVSKRGHNEDL